jgi:hypothetical protein
MMSELLNRLLAADDDGTNFGKLVPLIIFFAIWALSAISKAFQKGKKGTETEPEPSEEGEEPSFDDLARKIRERYAEAKEQAAKRASEQGGETTQQPPARPAKPAAAPVAPRLATTTPAPSYQPMFEVTKPLEEPTLRVVKGLEQPSISVPLTIERPTLHRVEPSIERVEGITSNVPMVSTEVHRAMNPYLAELAAQLATQDGFSKAILNYEILGPPIALREQNN